jgi:tRNA A37 threonylcarbamoyladenosine synthetase subunit TsaC/SUA5/YrdC
MAQVRDALEAGQIVGLPGVGTYLVAGSTEPSDVHSRLDALVADPREERTYLVGHIDQVRDLARSWSEEGQRLAERCWPGPLIIVVQRDQPGHPDEPHAASAIRVTMPTLRTLRHLCRDTGPWLSVALDLSSAAEVMARFSASEVSCVVDGGRCEGRAATVVDCRMSPPLVREEGVLPGAFIEATSMMASRRRRSLWSRIPGM